MDLFKVIKGTLKEVKLPWHKYLEGKTLILITWLDNTWCLAAIEGEDGLSGLCKYEWQYEEENGIEHEYYELTDFIESVKDSNDGFGFEHDEIQIIEEVINYDLDGALKRLGGSQ